jgi:phage tail-like protein
MSDKDPLVSAWFGIDFGGKVKGAFRECTGLGSENEIVEEKASTVDGKLILKHIPGRMKYSDITLKRGITDNMDMWQWRKMVEDGQVVQARLNGTIMMYDQNGEVTARWNLVNAWPAKLNGPSANATANEVGIEEFVITHEGYERVQ